MAPARRFAPVGEGGCVARIVVKTTGGDGPPLGTWTRLLAVRRPESMLRGRSVGDEAGQAAR